MFMYVSDVVYSLFHNSHNIWSCTVYPKKYAHGYCFAVLSCGYTLTDFPYPSGLLHWHCGNLTIAPVPAKQPWWIWINTSCESIMNDCITTTKQSTTKPCAYFLGYTVYSLFHNSHNIWNCMLVAYTFFVMIEMISKVQFLSPSIDQTCQH